MESGKLRTAGAPKVLIIEGEIGAGKTILTRAIVDRICGQGAVACAILEPVDLWKDTGALQAFYADPKRQAYSFQTFAFATRIRAIADAFAGNPEAEYFVLERSPATDALFWHLQSDVVSDLEKVMYDAWRDCFLQMLPFDLEEARVLYIEPSLEACMNRLTARARDGEVIKKAESGGVSIDYQRRLRSAHRASLFGEDSEESGAPASPFRKGNIARLPPEFADKDFRAGSPDSREVVDEALRLLNVSICV
jgi:deoxyadenosine/deoxycytidine kinase